MDERERDNLGGERGEQLPEHETRPEGREGGGMIQSGISADQYGPVNEEVLEAQEEEEPVMDPQAAPPAYRPKSG